MKLVGAKKAGDAGECVRVVVGVVFGGRVSAVALQHIISNQTHLVDSMVMVMVMVMIRQRPDSTEFDLVPSCFEKNEKQTATTRTPRDALSMIERDYRIYCGQDPQKHT